MLTILVNLGVLIVALMHLWFLILEMFMWQKPLGMKVFHLAPEFAEKTAALAANQGLYNGFLFAGLMWSLLSSDALEAPHLKIFFLSCVILAGIFGALTVNRKIFFVQSMPAVITLALLYVNRLT